MSEKRPDYIVEKNWRTSRPVRAFKMFTGLLFREIFCWRTWWCGLALYTGAYMGEPILGVSCLFLWVLFMILDELKKLNKRFK